MSGKCGIIDKDAEGKLLCVHFSERMHRKNSLMLGCACKMFQKPWKSNGFFQLFKQKELCSFALHFRRSENHGGPLWMKKQ